jgi:hypothetical protein
MRYISGVYLYLYCMTIESSVEVPMSIKAMMATILQNRLASRGVHSLTPSDYEEVVDTMIEQLTELELSLGSRLPMSACQSTQMGVSWDWHAAH